VKLRYHGVIIRIATIAIFLHCETPRTQAKEFCRELSRIGTVARLARYAQNRASFRSGEIRVLDSIGSVERGFLL